MSFDSQKSIAEQIELERIKGIRNGSANEKGSNRVGEQDNLTHQTTQNELWFGNNFRS